MTALNNKIIFVDDEENILKGLKFNFHRMFCVSTALSGEEALTIMEEQGPFSVVVSDMRMPGMDGITFLMKVKEKYPDTVRVMLTGNADLETAMNAVNEGNIFRFLTKPCNNEKMQQVLNDSIRQHDLIQAEKALMKMGTYDTLTKVYTRGAFLQIMETEFERSIRHKRPCSLLMADIDHFKRINDNYGHPKGDEVLAKVVAAMQDNVRRSDVLGRYGGEEFLGLLPETNLEQAKIVAEKLRAFTETIKFSIDEVITISIGVAELTEEIKTIDDIISAVDTKLYKAKQSGRNRVES